MINRSSRTPSSQGMVAEKPKGAKEGRPLGAPAAAPHGPLRSWSAGLPVEESRKKTRSDSKARAKSPPFRSPAHTAPQPRPEKHAPGTHAEGLDRERRDSVGSGSKLTGSTAHGEHLGPYGLAPLAHAGASGHGDGHGADRLASSPTHAPSAARAGVAAPQGLRVPQEGRLRRRSNSRLLHTHASSHADGHEADRLAARPSEKKTGAADTRGLHAALRDSNAGSDLGLPRALADEPVPHSSQPSSPQGLTSVDDRLHHHHDPQNHGTTLSPPKVLSRHAMKPQGTQRAGNFRRGPSPSSATQSFRADLFRSHRGPGDFQHLGLAGAASPRGRGRSKRSRSRSSSTGKTQGNFSFEGVRRQANGINTKDAKRLRRAWSEVVAEAPAAFGSSSGAALAGVEASALLTFIALSYTALPCNVRNSSHLDCRRYSEPGKKRIERAFRAVNRQLTKALSGHDTDSSAQGRAALAKKVALLEDVAKKGGTNTIAAPYLPHPPGTLLGGAQHAIGVATSLGQGHGRSGGNEHFEQTLEAFYKAVRRAAISAKAAYPRPEMMGAQTADLAQHAAEVEALRCPSGKELGAGQALTSGASQLEGHGSAFLTYVGSTLRAIARECDHFWDKCMSESACKVRVRCESPRATAVHAHTHRAPSGEAAPPPTAATRPSTGENKPSRKAAWMGA